MVQSSAAHDATASSASGTERGEANGADRDFYAELTAAIEPDTPDETSLDEPALFTQSPHWEAWREDHVFLPRAPAPLPRQRTTTSHGDTVSAQQAGAVTSGDVSGFRRMLAPVVIASTIALAALTHNAVANRASVTPPPPSGNVSEPFVAPFSLTGAWRRIVPVIAEVADDAATVQTKAQISPEISGSTPSDGPAEPANSPSAPPPLPEGATGTLVNTALDAICAIPQSAKSAAQIQSPASFAVEATVSQPLDIRQHPVSLIATPLTDLVPMEPWYVPREATLAVVLLAAPSKFAAPLVRVIATGAQITTKAVKVDSKVTQTAARPAKAVQKPVPQDEPEPRVVKAAPQPAAAPAVRYRSFDDIAKDSP